MWLLSGSQGEGVDCPTNPPAVIREVIPLCWVTVGEPHPGPHTSLTPNPVLFVSPSNRSIW